MHRRKLILGIAITGVLGANVNANLAKNKLTTQISQNLLKVVPQGWKVIERKKLQREFVFNNFVEAFGFMTKVAIACEKMDRYPEWSNLYNRVVITLTTDIAGISKLDIELAIKINTFN